MSPLPTFGANHDLVAALSRYSVRFMVVGGVATTHHVPERQTQNPGELDLLIEPTAANAGKVIAALHSIAYTHPEYTVERLARPAVRLPVDNGSFYADILTPEAGEDFAACWDRAAEDSIGYTPVKVIAIEDQIPRLKRSDKDKHARDVEMLERALVERQRRAP